MNTSLFLKKIVSVVFFRCGFVDKRIRQFWSNGFSPILMYHRVVPEGKLIQAGMYVSPETFEYHLILLAKYFNTIPLNSLSSQERFAGIVKNGKPPCILTFDDGWKDFYDYAFPLLVKYQQPATVFLPTGFIGSGKQFWTDCFANLLSHRMPATLERFPDSAVLTNIAYLNSLRGSFDNQLEKGIEYLKQYSLNTIADILSGLSKLWQVDIAETDADFVTWAEVTEMMDSGLVSFGSHTVSHSILTTLDDKAIEKELNDSRKELLEKNVVDGSCISFCYPNGNHTEKITDMVRSAGYHLAVTTKNGWNHTGANKYSLKRIGIHQDMSSTPALFACRIAGLI